MSEYEIYQEEIINLFTEWVNRDDKDSAELANSIIRKFAIKEIKDQCMVKSICFSFQILIEAEDMTGCGAVHERAVQYVAFNSHILAHIALGEWEKVNERLTE